MKTHASFLNFLFRVLLLKRIIAVSFSTMCFIRVDLSKAAKALVPKGQGYHQLDYDVIIFFGQTELQAQLVWMTKVCFGTSILTAANIVFVPVWGMPVSLSEFDWLCRLTCF